MNNNLKFWNVKQTSILKLGISRSRPHKYRQFDMCPNKLLRNATMYVKGFQK